MLIRCGRRREESIEKLEIFIIERAGRSRRVIADISFVVACVFSFVSTVVFAIVNRGELCFCFVLKQMNKYLTCTNPKLLFSLK